MICFLFHWLLGVTALAGAIILVTLTLITEFMIDNPLATYGRLSQSATKEKTR